MRAVDAELGVLPSEMMEFPDRMNRRSNLIAWIILAWLGLAGRAGLAGSIDFDRDVRPILAGKCFACHGPDATSLRGDLRLDLRDDATHANEQGRIAIVPHQPDRSELIRRIESADDEIRMPPADANKHLTAAEKIVLRQWVTEGAAYARHWSFAPLARVRPPAVQQCDWPRNGIDRFILAELESHGMTSSPEASRTTLIRRVSLDLRGLPPTLQEIDCFTNDASPNAYEAMVDRMLASPQFGERMAMVWLDLARYGDTNGYHNDSDRPVWVWRDWVIDAYNRNLPFDVFTEWQLAGDLLPNATLEQKVASGFNRNVRFNEEGGADPNEFLAVYAADRAITMGRIWLGLTLNCAQCHSHKYDPISQREFYQLTAFFNSLEEVGAGGPTGFHGIPVPPVIRVKTRRMEQEIATVSHQLAQLQQQLAQIFQEIVYVDPGFQGDPTQSAVTSQLAWEESLLTATSPLLPQPIAAWDFTQGLRDSSGSLHGELQGGARLTSDGLVLDGVAAHVTTSPLATSLSEKTLEAFVKLESLSQAGGAVIGVQTGMEQENPLRFDAIVYGEREPGRWIAGSDFFERTQDVGGEAESTAHQEVVQIAITYQQDGAIQVYRNGRPYGKSYTVPMLRTFPAGNTRVVFGARALPPGGNFMLKGILQRARLYDRALRPEEVAATAGDAKLALPTDMLTLVQTPRNQRTSDQQRLLRDYYVRYVHRATRERIAPLQRELDYREQRLAQLQDENHLPLQMVSVELPQPKPAFVLMRGDFETPGEQVQRDVPEFLPPYAADLPRNRLGLARWLMRTDQPLVARVQVNRFWQMLMGEGLVRTVGDFGAQGAYPSHPALLDWLAARFIESEWNVKQMLKLIVMSSTYRQASDDTRRYADRDPENRLLWRASRVRLQAEVIRDNALAVAGLLSDPIGGPPVFPYQPVDFYRGKNNGWQWQLSQNADRYRRGMYTFWRRTTPYPSFVIFDAPDRAECTFERPRTNTPLQALVTLNDPEFVAAARGLAERVTRESPSEIESQLAWSYRLTLARVPTETEVDVLRRFWEHQYQYYGVHGQEANELVGSQLRSQDAMAARAAWIAVGNVLLNLDEAITRN